MKKLPSSRTRCSGFTLVELLVCIGIIALLANLTFPIYTSVINKANSTKCGANLRAIGVAAQLAAVDNDNKYIDIDQAALLTAPPNHYPGILTAFTPYGIVDAQVRCPSDMQLGAASGYQTFIGLYGQAYASSYEWNPTFDDEETNATAAYVQSGAAPFPVASSRVRLAIDYTPVHRAGTPHPRVNAVYGDGHVAVY